jgi:hypothetical protein
MLRLSPVLALAALLGGCGLAPEASPPTLSEGPCRAVSVNSDYSSTSVSLLDGEGRLCAARVLSSGSAPPGIVSALSGDVVPASTRHPDSWIALVDRYPNSVLTFVHPDERHVISQLSVGTGFAANPQDVAFLSRTKAYVSRAETNKAPGRELFDEGGDVLVIDPAAPRIESRISLLGFTDAGPGGEPLDPRPGGFALAGGLVWVHLHHLSRDLSAAGPGLVLGLDPSTDEVREEIRLDAFRNCSAIDAPPGGEGFWLACSGRFGDREEQINRSGLAWVDLSSGEAKVAWSASAEDMSAQPLSFYLAAEDEHVAYAVVFGDLEEGRPDVLLRVDRRADPPAREVANAPAYGRGQPLFSEELSVLMVPRGDPESPSVMRFERGPDGTLTPLTPTDPDPAVGLPPRHLGWFR